MNASRVRGLAIVLLFLEAGELVVYSAVLSSHRGGSWAFPTFLTAICLQTLTLMVVTFRSRRRLRQPSAAPAREDR